MESMDWRFRELKWVLPHTTNFISKYMFGKGKSRDVYWSYKKLFLEYNFWEPYFFCMVDKTGVEPCK
jgi:hypothetical protein